EGGSTSKSFIPGNTTACVAIVYDINGNQKPNEVGKDIGELNAVLGDDDCIQVGSLCFAKADTSYSAVNTCTDTTWDSRLTTNMYCASNGWAGAKKACGDLGWRLPSDTELTIITKNSGIKSLLNMSGTYWSSTEFSPHGAIYRFFPSGGYNHGYYYYDKYCTGKSRCVK
ncbi:MAG: hypothetical protein PHC64_08930, partial [Candidatus Gastranaerophilales bacterium]|nr:hypothetical protein [Candidatus Gastranaerophilales bacterium]